MSVFRYTALSPVGKETGGTIEAADRPSAAAMLRGRDLVVIDLRQPSTSPPAVATDTSQPPRRWTLGRLIPVLDRDRSRLLRDLSLMLRSGLTILQALRVIQKQGCKAGIARAVRNVTVSIQAGESLSTGLAQQKNLLPLFAMKLIESAEHSGEMEQAMVRAAQQIDRRWAHRTRLITSLFYPVIVFLIATVVASFLVLVVIPKLASFILKRGGTLPWAAQFLIDLADFIRLHGLALVLLTAGLLVSLAVTYATVRGRRMFDRAVLSVPLVGHVLTAGAMSQISWALATLLRSGVTLLEALRITSGTVASTAFKNRLSVACDGILAGRDLASSLQHRLIPPLMIEVVRVGEQTGALPEVLEEIGRTYDERLQDMIQKMGAMIEPVMIVIVGGMVGFVYFAFFQAVLALTA